MMGDHEIGVVGNRKVRWTTYETTRFNAGALRVAHPDIWEEFAEKRTVRRFSVAEEEVRAKMAAATPRNTSSVREKVQQQARHTAVAERKPDPTVTLRATLERMKPQIQAALPKHMTADRLARIVMTQVRLNPKLLECSTESLLAAVM